MARDEILKRLRENGDLLKQLNIRSLAIFGSAARDELHAESDIDLLVDFSQKIGLFHFARAQRQLEDLLDMKVHLVHRDALRPELKQRILDERVHV